MKIAKLISLVLVILFFASCSSKKEFAIHKRRYSNGYYIAQSSGPLHSKPVRASVPKVSVTLRDKVSCVAEVSPKAAGEITFPEEHKKFLLSAKSKAAKIQKEPVRCQHGKLFRKSSGGLHSSKKSVSDSDAEELLFGILFLLGGLSCWAISYYLMYFVATPVASLFLIALLVIAGIVLWSVGSYMIKDSLGLSDSCGNFNSCNSFWFL
jgi:hypothetical protein